MKLGDLNGYIEEMINGQKVVKVFCHEEEAQEGFDRVNDALFESAYKANKYANILMPILINIGNIQYVVIAWWAEHWPSMAWGRYYPGCHRILPPALQEFDQPNQPDLSAAQLCGHGSGRCSTDF